MRRVWMGLLLLWLTMPAKAQTGVAVPEMAQSDAAIQKFMERWKIPGASVAISHHGRLVYERAFGYADLARTEPMQPHHLLRVASVSKPITAAAIMKLVETGQLALRHRVFGPAGYLTDAYYTGVIQDSRIYDITVQQLLEHTAGWNRNNSLGDFPGSDPIDFPLHVANMEHAPNPVGDSTMLRFMLGRGLDFTPGSRFAYSNIGYLILGKIIEKQTGQSYEQWVRTHILAPSGIREAHLGRNLLADKHEREAEYFSPARAVSCYGNGRQVPFAYGGWNLEAMSAHGGWVFSARDLVRFMLATDGFATRPDLLTAASLDTMVTSDELNRRYAKGWMVNKDRTTWWHTGSLDGTASCVARTASGHTWAILLNARALPNRFWNDLEELGWACIRSTGAWPGHDLFPPTQNAGQLQATATGPTTARLRWANGNGNSRLLLVQDGQPAAHLPLDGTNYVADATYGRGALLGHGSVVAAGPDSVVTVRNLLPGHTYFARVVEYFQHDSTAQHPVYLLEGNPLVEFRTPVAPAVARRGKAAKITAARRPASRPKRAAVAPKAATQAAPAAEPQDESATVSYLTVLRDMSRALLRIF